MNAIEYNAVLPHNISRLIDKKGLKRGAIAQKSGFNSQQFCDLLKGRRIIKAIDVIRISDALGVTPNELFATDHDTQDSA